MTKAKPYDIIQSENEREVRIMTRTTLEAIGTNHTVVATKEVAYEDRYDAMNELMRNPEVIAVHMASK